MIKDYFRLAYQSVRKRKMRSWLTMIGIFIGIAAVVALISLSQGLQDAIGEQFIKLGSDKVIVQGISSGFGPPGTGVETPLTKKDLEVVEKVKGVDNVIGRLVRSAKMEYKDEVKYSFVVSMPEKNEDIALTIEVNDYNIKQGRLLKKGDKFVAMIGSNFADDFFETELILRDKIKIEGVDFKVIGILKKSGNPQQDETIVIPEEAIRSIFGLQEVFDLIPAKIGSGENMDLIAGRIKKALRKHREVEEGKEDFTVETPQNILATLTTILLIVQGVLVGIAGISLVVGGIGIMNTMYTAVLERTKEIGIMKATGARDKQVLFLFLVESGMLGMFGGLIGVSIGFGISKLIEYVAFQIYGSFLIKASVNLWVLFGALMFAFLVGAASGVFPARQAAKLRPVDALRK